MPHRERSQLTRCSMRQPEYQMDVAAAFLQCAIDKDVWVKPAPGQDTKLPANGDIMVFKLESFDTKHPANGDIMVYKLESLDIMVYELKSFAANPDNRKEVYHRVPVLPGRRFHQLRKQDAVSHGSGSVDRRQRTSSQ